MFPTSRVLFLLLVGGRKSQVPGETDGENIETPRSNAVLPVIAQQHFYYYDHYCYYLYFGPFPSFETAPTLSRSCFSPRPSVPQGMKTLKNPQLSAIELSCRLPPVGPRGVRGRDRRSSQQASLSLSLFFFIPRSALPPFSPQEKQDMEPEITEGSK